MDIQAVSTGNSVMFAAKKKKSWWNNSIGEEYGTKRVYIYIPMSIHKDRKEFTMFLC